MRRDEKRNNLRKAIGVLLGIGAASSAAAQTAITIDGSFGRTPGQLGPSATNTTVTGNRNIAYTVNNRYTIAESQGRVAGINLFHSFGTFNIGTGDAAVFTTTTPTLQNIVARVSGPSASTIQGLLAVNAVSGSNPNLFLINPAGVTFGTGAIVDVPAAFHVSTANELRFADGTVFKAGTGIDSSITMAAPEAFGFIGGNANIAFNNVRGDVARFNAGAFIAQSFDVTAGAVTFDNSAVSIRQAQVRLLGNGAVANSIPVNGAPAVTPQGDVRLTASSLNVGSFTDASANPADGATGIAGDISIFGRNVLLDDTTLRATTEATSQVTPTQATAGAIRIRSAGDITLLGATSLQAELLGFPNSDGNPGTIDIIAQGNISAAAKPGGPSSPTLRTSGGRSASSISLRSLGGGDIAINNATIATRGQGSGAAGNIQLDTNGSVLLLDSTVSATGNGTGTGDINVRGTEIVLNGASSISTTLLDERNTFNGNPNSGGVGSITLNAASRVAIGANASITARSVGGGLPIAFGANPGTIRVSTPQIDLDGTIAAASESAFGSDGALLRLGQFDANDIVLDGGNAGLILQGTGAVASSNPRSGGRAGELTLRGRDVTISGVQLGSTDNVNSGGNLLIMADGRISLSDVRIQSNVGGDRGVDDRILVSATGGIELAARAIDIDSTQILSQAPAGSTGLTRQITARATDAVRITNSTLSVANDANVGDPSFINDQQNGQIRLTAPTITLDNTTVSAESSQNVIAGSIVLEAAATGNTPSNARVTLNQSNLSSSATGTSTAGQITITSGIVSLTDSSITSEEIGASTGQFRSSITGGTSRTPGTVGIDATGDLTVANTRISSNTEGAVGRAGNIRLFTPTTLQIDSSQISSQAAAGSSGQTGFINLFGGNSLGLTNSTLSIANDASVANPTAIAQGQITVGAGQLMLKNSAITADSTQNVTASAVDVFANGSLTLDTSTISSSAQGTAAAGDITVDTNGIGMVTLIDTSITGEARAAKTSQLTVRGSQVVLDGASRLSTSLLGGSATTTGGVGAIRITARDNIVVGANASIDARTVGSFDNPDQAAPGEVRLTAPRLEVAGTITTATLGNVTASNITVDSETTLAVAGVLTSSTSGAGNAGSIDVGGTSVSLSGAMINSASTSGASGVAGTVTLHAAEDLSLANATVRTDTAGSGNAGNITLTARNITLDPSLISSQAASGSSGQTGTIDVTASQSLELRGSTLSIANDASVADPTAIAQGRITVSADRLMLRNSVITADSTQNVTASAIDVFANGSLTLDASTISSSAQGTAAAGDITVDTNGIGIVTLIDTSITGEARAAKTSQLTISGSQVVLDGASRLSTSLLGGPTTTTGGVGAIRITARDNIVVGANASIDARTVGSFDNPDQAAPGEVRLTAPRLEVAGTITTATLGNVTASNITVDSETTLAVAGVLTSSTSGAGNAGSIDIGGTSVSLSGAMINSASTSGASGVAGTVTLHATEDLSLANATVRTDTAGSGNAGNITLTARNITIDPSLISSQAASGSSGQTGTIDVTASQSLELRDSTLSIANAARVADPSMTPLGRIRLGAPVVRLRNSNVTAQSSENVAASAIAIDAADFLTIRNSNVTTSAQDGNGGRIDVRGQRVTVLEKSQISTSVRGTQSGSGGDITVRTNLLLVKDGFVQANTAAQGASGGNVVLAVGQLLPIGELVTGGDVPLSFDPQRTGLNAIQAAAPDGVSGIIQVTGPTLDVVGDLQRIEAELVVSAPLGQDLCKQGRASSLTQLGRGGLRPLSTGLVRPESAMPLLPNLPALSLRLDAQAPSSGKCGQ